MAKKKIISLNYKTNTVKCNCGEIVPNCSNDAVKVTCWRCVCLSLNPNTEFVDRNNRELIIETNSIINNIEE